MVAGRGVERAVAANALTGLSMSPGLDGDPAPCIECQRICQ